MDLTLGLEQLRVGLEDVAVLDVVGSTVMDLEDDDDEDEEYYWNHRREVNVFRT